MNKDDVNTLNNIIEDSIRDVSPDLRRLYVGVSDMITPEYLRVLIESKHEDTGYIDLDRRLASLRLRETRLLVALSKLTPATESYVRAIFRLKAVLDKQQDYLEEGEFRDRAINGVRCFE